MNPLMYKPSGVPIPWAKTWLSNVPWWLSKKLENVLLLPILRWRL